MYRLILAMVLTGVISVEALGQANSFSYQGQLKEGGIPVNGSYNLVFKLFSASSGGSQVGSTIIRNGVVIHSGLFQQTLDFGPGAFTGQPRWLEIAAKGVVLGRQPLTATPYALYALNGPGSGLWQASGANIFNTNTSNVGIGTNDTTHRLTVAAPDQETVRLLNLTTEYGERARLNFGDGDYVYLEEDVDDALLIQANRIALSGGEVRLPGGANPPGYNSHFNYSGDGRNYIRGATIISDTGGNVGIGTTTPNAATQLNVFTNAAGYQAVRGDAPDGNGVVGTSHRAGYGAVAGVNYANLVGGIGVYGEAHVGTGAKGVWGASNEGIGVYGTCASAQTNDSGGVVGRNFANNGNGVIGEANAGSSAYGVWGRSSGGKGVYGEGVDGLYGIGSNYGVVGIGRTGVFGRSTGDQEGDYAVYAYGKLGAFGSKSFRIDHPADPANRYLLHYSTESPEILNFYSGKVSLDAAGEAVVELPSYFARINKDPRYMLTAMGSPMPDLHIAREIDEIELGVAASATPEHSVSVSSFQIAGGAPGGKVSWRVEAVRNDPFVRVFGAAIEAEKPEHDRGRYQLPELYGKPAEMGINYRPAKKDVSASDTVQELEK